MLEILDPTRQDAAGDRAFDRQQLETNLLAPGGHVGSRPSTLRLVDLRGDRLLSRCARRLLEARLLSDSVRAVSLGRRAGKTQQSGALRHSIAFADVDRLHEAVL